MSVTYEQPRLDDLPRSRQVVLAVLREADTPLTTRELAERTAEYVGTPYDQRTAQRAVHDLSQRGLVEQHASLGPAPKPRYSVNATD